MARRNVPEENGSSRAVASTGPVIQKFVLQGNPC